MVVIQQYVLAQNRSCVAALAYPPASGTGDAEGWTTLMSKASPSDWRRTW
ncbi:MAG TPA: hypothetical protein VN893_05005 [Bryobacteraceae bacterium]|nr:hypothetical protein [Bryobacteraceae bacterium]